MVSLADYNASIIEDRGMLPLLPLQYPKCLLLFMSTIRCLALALAFAEPPISTLASPRSMLTTGANGMVEALVLWESVANSNWFAKSSMILFLNKADVFSAKIRDPQQQIHSTFPDYNGKPGNYQDGVHYFKNRFQGLSKGQKEVYVHVTTAVRTCDPCLNDLTDDEIDTENLKVIMAAVVDTITRNSLREMAII